MSHRFLLMSAVASLLLFSGPVRAQEAGTARGSTESTALQKKAIKLLGSVASQVDTLHSGENRARIGSNVAELLWDQDEKRARALFGAVEAEIKTGLNDADTDESAHLYTLEVFLHLRSDTLERIAKHDPQLALEFLRRTRPASDAEFPEGLMADEKSLEARLANRIAARNPDLALKLGLASLEKGVSTDLLPVLSEIYRKDKPTALVFHRAIVAKLKGMDLGQDPQTTELAIDLAQEFQPPKVDEQVYRDLIGAIMVSAISNECGNERASYLAEICFTTGRLFSKMEKYFGARAAPLKRWFQGEKGVDNPQVEMWEQICEVIEKGTVDEILALAPKYPEMEVQIRFGAVKKAEASGDVARARQIASDAPEVEQRNELVAEIERDQMWKTINAEKIAAIRPILASFPRDEERVNFLLFLVSEVKSTDRKAALGFLNQASEIVDAGKPGQTQLEGRMRLAVEYCSFNSDRGFVMMESMLPKLNELVAASVTLEGFGNNYIRDGEWNMSAAGSVGALLTKLAESAGSFGRLDFDRSVNLAGQFERPELRLMAHLKIAQGVLTNQTILPPVNPLLDREVP